MTYGVQSGKQRFIVKSASQTLFSHVIDEGEAEAKAIQLCQIRQWGGSRDIAFFVNDRLAYALVPGIVHADDGMLLFDLCLWKTIALFRIGGNRLSLVTPTTEEKL